MDAFVTKALRLASESRSTQAAAQQVGSSPQLRYRWQQAQLMAEVGSVEAARDPEARPTEAGRARARHVKESLGHPWPTNPVCTYRYITQRPAPESVRQLCQTLRLVVALPKPLPVQHFALLGEALPPS